MEDYKKFEKVCLTIYGSTLIISGIIYIMYEIFKSINGFNQPFYFTISGTVIVIISGILALWYVFKDTFILLSNNKLHHNVCNTFIKEKLKIRCKICNKHPYKIAGKGTTQYYLESIIKGLSETPSYIRCSANIFFNQAVHSFSFYVLYTIVCISGLLGLTDFIKSPVGNLSGWILVFYLIFTWLITFLKMSKIIKKEKQSSSEKISNLLVIPIIGTILSPLILHHLNNIAPIPKVSSSPLLFLFIEGLISFTISVVFFIFIIKRIHNIKPHDHVSAKRYNFTIKLDPIKFIHYFEKLISKKGYQKGYKKPPLLKKKNKIFDGYVIYESEVIPQKMEKLSHEERMLMTVAGVGHSIFFIGILSFLYFLSVRNLNTAALFLLIICGLSGSFTYILTLLFGKEQFYTSHLLCLSLIGHYSNDNPKNAAANDEAMSTISESTSCSMASSLYVVKLKTSAHLLGKKRYINNIEEDNDSFKEINRLFEQCISKKEPIKCYSHNYSQIITDKKKLKELAYNMVNAHNIPPSNKEKTMINVLNDTLKNI